MRIIDKNHVEKSNNAAAEGLGKTRKRVAGRNGRNGGNIY